VLCSLGLLRKRVAEDISLLLRDDDPFVPALLPTPNGYAFPHQAFVRCMGRLLADVLAREQSVRRHVSVLPTYVPGGSVRVHRNLAGPLGRLSIGHSRRRNGPGRSTRFFRYPNAARASGLIVGFAAPGPAELRAAFAALDLLLLNRHEAQAITGTRTLAAAAAALRRVFTGGCEH